MDNRVPNWLTEILQSYRETIVFQDSLSTQAHLDNTRKEMYQALSDFYGCIKHIFYFSLAIIGSSGAIVGYAIKSNFQSLGFFLAFASILLLSAIPLGMFAVFNMRERYRCYVSAVVYAYQVHMAVGIESHPWFDWINVYMNKKKFMNVQEITEYWINTPPNAYIYYKWSIFYLSFLIVSISVILIAISFHC